MPDALRVASLLGDGIGPEIVPAARRVVDAALAAAGATAVQWVDLPMGAAAIAEHGRAIPLDNYPVLESCQGWLVGPHDSASYPREWREGPERVPGAELRSRYRLYSNVRPARNRPGVTSMAEGVDLVIVRENTEGLYSDRNLWLGNGELMPTDGVVLTVGLFTRDATRRIAREAFELARQRRKHVTIVHKSNVMPVAFGMFVDEVRDVGRAFPEVEVDDVLLDAMAAYLVRRPETFDVIVTENLFGDTLSDLTGELVGALGMAQSLNAGVDYAMAQAAHGSAPDIAGRGVANPIGMIGSAAMLLEWLGHKYDDDATTVAGRSIDAAIDTALERGLRTPDLGGSATTDEVADAVAAAL